MFGLNKKFYTIKFAAVSITGRIRAQNQDSMYTPIKYTTSPGEVFEYPVCGSFTSDELPLFCVYDGMGGEKFGELASTTASVITSKYTENRKGVQGTDFLYNLCDELNAAVCEIQRQKNVDNIGTTGAMMLFGEKDIAVCNVGDSRVYKLANGAMYQLTVDHCAPVMGSSRKAPLTQFLGVPPEEFIIQPHVARGSYADKDRFLICSDGITDMISDEDIRSILINVPDTEACIRTLVNVAMQNGGVDNTTAIVCDINA